MLAHTVYFSHPKNKQFFYMLEVLKLSFQENMPESRLEVHLIDPPRQGGKSWTITANNHKLPLWTKIVHEATEPIALIDCDMMLIGDISDAFDKDYDIAYTVRPGPLPFNAGAIYVKPTQLAKDFFDLWLSVNNQMYRDVHFHGTYRRKYGGLNQAALGFLLEQREYSAQVRTLPGHVFNACHGQWGRPGNKLIHIKDKLRRSMFGEQPVQANMKKIVRTWHNYYASLQECDPDKFEDIPVQL
jgi:hypothetical protein